MKRIGKIFLSSVLVLTICMVTGCGEERNKNRNDTKEDKRMEASVTPSPEIAEDDKNTTEKNKNDNMEVEERTDADEDGIADEDGMTDENGIADEMEEGTERIGEEAQDIMDDMKEMAGDILDGNAEEGNQEGSF